MLIKRNQIIAFILLFFLIFNSVVLAGTRWEEESFDYEVEVTVPASPPSSNNLTWATASFGYSVDVEGYEYTTWSPYWKIGGFPSGITSVTVENYNSTAINLTWVRDENNTDAVIHYSKTAYPTSRSEGTLLYNGSNLTYNHTGLDYGTRYYYSFWGYNSTSNVFSASYNTGDNYTNPGPPNSLQDTSSTTTSISFSWNKGTNATRTVIFRNASGVGGFPNRSNGVEVINTTGSTDTASGLAKNQTYNFSAYSFNPSSWLWSETNITDNGTTLAEAGDISAFTAAIYNDTQINLSWTKGETSDTTMIRRRVGSYPTLTTGTEVINNYSFSTYKDKGLTPGTHYYYRAWAWNGVEYGSTTDTDEQRTRPQPPQNFTGDIESSELAITWDKGTNASITIVRSRTGAWPTDPTNGTQVYNGTGTSETVSGVSSINYIRGWGAGIIDGQYMESLYVNLIWGGLEVNVYKEDEPWIAIGNYTVFILNPATEEVYQNTSQNNPFRVDTEDVPNGQDITVKIQKQGYKTRTQVIDLYENVWTTLNFYLPASSEGSPSGESGEPWYIPPETDDTSLITDIFGIGDYTTDETHTLECSPDEIEMVYVWNNSIYGGWDAVDEGNYSLSGNKIIVLADALDENSTQLRVEYYCTGDIDYAVDYIIDVKDIDNDPIRNAYVVIKRYINDTANETDYDQFDTVESGETGAGGHLSVSLIPDSNYIISISKTGYTTYTDSFRPVDISYGIYEELYLQFVLEYEEGDVPDIVTPEEILDLTGSINATGVINISYLDINSNTTNTHMILYRFYNFTLTPLYYYNLTGDSSWNISLSGYNASMEYLVKLFVNHSEFDYTILLIEEIYPYDVGTPEAEIENMWDAIFGTWGLGFVKFLIIFLPCMFFLVVFGKANVGLGIICAGLYMAFSTTLVYINSTVSYITLGLVIVVVGIALILIKRGGSNL